MYNVLHFDEIQEKIMTSSIDVSKNSDSDSDSDSNCVIQILQSKNTYHS